MSRRGFVVGSGAFAVNADLAQRSCAGGVPPRSPRRRAAPPSNGPSAPKLRLDSAPIAYPPRIAFTRPADWSNGDLLTMQWAQDPDFVKDVTQRPPVAVDAARNGYDFGLAALGKGVYFVRMHARRISLGNVAPNWSNTVQVGQTPAPVITTAPMPTVSGFSPLALSLTADQPVRQWIVVGGSDHAFVDVDDAKLVLTGGGTLDCFVKATYVVTIRAVAFSGLYTDKLLTIAVSMLPRIGA